MRNIIVTGAGFANKGAQAMTFIVVDEMKKRFPDHRILVLSADDLQRPESERKKFTFDFMGWYPIKFARAQNNPLLKLAYRLHHRAEWTEMYQIYHNTDLMLDISGYALGSDWSASICTDYLDHLEFARAFHIPVYLLPQSFGPFAYTYPEGEVIERRTAELLPYARAIFAREQEGLDALQNRYHLKNVQLLPDLVLNNRGIDAKNIYHQLPESQLPDIVPGSVAVVPNAQNFFKADAGFATAVYTAAIKSLLRYNKKVYILSHSMPDAEICRLLKAEFQEDSRVVLLERELNCLEFSALLKSFKYVFASRFHSIVHSYKCNVPVIALGWARKYHDLLGQFGQKDYLLDIRESDALFRVDEVIQRMEQRYSGERSVIAAQLELVQRENIFDLITM